MDWGRWPSMNVPERIGAALWMAVLIPVLCCDVRGARAQVPPQGAFGTASATDQSTILDLAGDGVRFAQVPTPAPPQIQPNPVQPSQVPPARPVTPPTRPNPSLVQPSQPATGPSTNTLAYNSASMAGNATLGLAGAPNMIGDSLGFPFFFVAPNGIARTLASVSLVSGDGPTKIADDTSPLPTDRVFFDYNSFNNALLTANGGEIGLIRYSIGVEKTFFDKTLSVEIKAPIDNGLDSTQDLLASTADNEASAFGNLAIIPKLLLYSDSTWTLAGGLAIGVPTAPDASLRIGNNPLSIDIDNESVHLAPFLGLLIAPGNRLFSITYLQFDFDANGNTVTETAQGTVFARGKLRNPTLMYVDTTLGYWLYQSSPNEAGGYGWLTGIAPVVELHYTTTLQDAEPATNDRFNPLIIPLRSRLGILNLTAGLQFVLGPQNYLTVSGVAPLRTEPGDKQFDAEVVVQFNHRF
jgi:hypothetical protein